MRNWCMIFSLGVKAVQVASSGCQLAMVGERLDCEEVVTFFKQGN